MLNLFANLQTPIFWLQIEFPFIERSRRPVDFILKKNSNSSKNIYWKRKHHENLLTRFPQYTCVWSFAILQTL